MNTTSNIFSTETPELDRLYLWDLFVYGIIPLFIYFVGFREDERRKQIDNVVVYREKPITEKDSDYLNTNRSKFLSMFREEELEPDKRIDYHSQIKPIFYNLSEMSEVIKNENNEIEAEWKTRILLKNTHRGNIAMYYNVYKQGFTYYADQQFIPYSVLNGLAMEYVRSFRCLDFFMDEIELPEGIHSKIVTLHEMEEKKEKEGKKKINKIDDLNLKDAPFAKFKPSSNSSSANNKPDLDKTTDEKNKQLALKKRNCFIYGGKIRDMNVWKTEAKEKTKLFFKSDLLPKVNMGYAAYKQLMKEQSK